MLTRSLPTLVSELPIDLTERFILEEDGMDFISDRMRLAILE